MRAILVVTLILGVSGLLANTAWVIRGAINDKLKGDMLATIDRNLKASGINIAMAVVMMLVVVIARALKQS